MADVFVSYAAEDGEVARYVAEGLEEAGYTIWYYQKHGQTPGADYLDNIGQGVRDARAVVLFVSDSALSSPQCESEARIAWEENKEVIPLLSGFSFDVLKAKERGRRWVDRIGTRVSIEIDANDPESVLQAVLAGLRATVRPGRPVSAASAAPAQAAAPASPAKAPAGTAVAAIVGALGLPYCLLSLSHALSPDARTPDGWVLSNFSTFRTVTLLVNLAGTIQNGLLLYGAWLLHRREARGAPLARKVALTMLVSVAVWLVVSLVSFTGASAQAAIPNPADRSKLIGGTIFFGLVALVPSGLVFALFRGARK